MNFIQFVAPLIGGYWFLWKWNYTKFVVKEDSGYHLFFKSSIAGIILLVIANLLILIIDFYNFSTPLGLTSGWIPSGFEPASVLAMAMGIASAYFLNCFYSASDGLTRAAEDRGNYLFLMIQEAFDKSMMIEVTLNSGKVYIGSPLSEMPFESEYLHLIPYFSGYREKETQKLIVSETYANEIKSVFDSHSYIVGQILLRKFRVIAPTKDIASARLFYPKNFEVLDEKGLNS